MTAKTQKPQPVVTLKIKRGPVTERQRRLWRSWWMRLIAEYKREPMSEAQK